MIINILGEIMGKRGIFKGKEFMGKFLGWMKTSGIY